MRDLIEADDHETLQALIGAGEIDINVLVDAEEKIPFTPVSLALCTFKFKCFEVLLNAGANLLTVSGTQQWTTLQWAVFIGRDDLVGKIIVRATQDRSRDRLLSARGHDNRTALMIAQSRLEGKAPAADKEQRRASGTDAVVISWKTTARIVELLSPE